MKNLKQFTQFAIKDQKKQSRIRGGFQTLNLGALHAPETPKGYFGSTYEGEEVNPNILGAPGAMGAPGAQMSLNN